MIKISGYMVDVSISVDTNTKFGKIYPLTNIFRYFINFFIFFPISTNIYGYFTDSSLIFQFLYY